MFKYFFLFNIFFLFLYTVWHGILQVNIQNKIKKKIKLKKMVKEDINKAPYNTISLHE